MSQTIVGQVSEAGNAVIFNVLKRHFTNLSRIVAQITPCTMYIEGETKSVIGTYGNLYILEETPEGSPTAQYSLFLHSQKVDKNDIAIPFSAIALVDVGSKESTATVNEMRVIIKNRKASPLMYHFVFQDDVGCHIFFDAVSNLYSEISKSRPSP